MAKNLRAEMFRVEIVLACGGQIFIFNCRFHGPFDYGYYDAIVLTFKKQSRNYPGLGVSAEREH